MAMKKRFYHANGQMMAYDEGGVTKDFLTDHLGSITAEIDQNQNRTFETRYSAFGRNNWSTGTGCGFGWVGSYGYRETGLFHMSHYVRARHYSYLTGAWSTVDPLWPREASYGYVKGEATRAFDLMGRDQGYPYYPPGGPWPTPPSNGPKGCMDYSRGIDPWFTWGYGNCCGGFRKCGPGWPPKDIPPVKGRPNKGGGKKYDCLDLACYNHDVSIPDFWTYILPQPHETLCSAVKKCDCAAMYMHGTSEYVDCLDAKRDLIVYACSSAWVFKGNGTPILAFPGDSQPSPPVLGLPAKRKDGK